MPYQIVRFDEHNQEHKPLYKQAQKIDPRLNLRFYAFGDRVKFFIIVKEDEVQAYIALKFLKNGRKWIPSGRTKNAWILDYYRVASGCSCKELTRTIMQTIDDETRGSRLFAEVATGNLISLNVLCRHLKMRAVEFLDNYYPSEDNDFTGHGVLIQRATEPLLLTPVETPPPPPEFDEREQVTISVQDIRAFNWLYDQDCYAVSATENSITFQRNNGKIQFDPKYRII